MSIRPWLVAMLFCLASFPALAVNLGQVQMQSNLGQPLLARIPVYDAEQADLDSLYVHLASDDAFKRLGIDRSLYRNVQIRVVSDEQGNPFVEISSTESFNEPVLNLLLDANWRNNGRLVREVTALVDPPYIAKAAIQTIDAPTVTLSPVVAAPVVISETSTPPVANGNDSKPKPQADVSDVQKSKPVRKPAAAQTASAPKPAPVAPAPAAPPVRIAATDSNQREVQKNESLYTIALEHKAQLGSQRISLNQMMSAIQRANPEAFIRGDANLLKRGSILRLPDEPQVRALLPDDSANLLAGQWARKVQAQPAPVLGAANKLAAKPGNPAASGKRPVAAPQVNQGQLKIVPTVGSMNNAGSQSGASKSGQGSELRAENTVAQEDLAAKQAEITNLRQQLQDTAKLQAESKQLIELQNTQIKQLTQRMKELQQRDANAVSSSVQAAPDYAKAPQSPWYFSPYTVFAALLLVAALLGVLLKRKR